MRDSRKCVHQKKGAKTFWTATGALVLEGAVVPPYSLVAGVPAKVKKALSAEEVKNRIDYYTPRSVAYNQSRGVHNVQLYETGVVFFGAEGHKKPKERANNSSHAGAQRLSVSRAKGVSPARF